MNIRSFRIVPVTLSVIMALATGCGTVSTTTSAPAQPDPELTDITVAALPTADLAGLYIAQDQGLFARQGLHATIEPIASSQAVIADQLKGQVDVSAGSYISYIAAQAAGASPRACGKGRGPRLFWPSPTSPSRESNTATGYWPTWIRARP